MEQLVKDVTTAVHRTQFGDLSNDLGNWTDHHGVLHIRQIQDEWEEYTLVNGKWVLTHDSVNKPF